MNKLHGVAAWQADPSLDIRSAANQILEKMVSRPSSKEYDEGEHAHGYLIYGGYALYVDSLMTTDAIVTRYDAMATGSQVDSVGLAELPGCSGCPECKPVPAIDGTAILLDEDERFAVIIEPNFSDTAEVVLYPDDEGANEYANRREDELMTRGGVITVAQISRRIEVAQTPVPIIEEAAGNSEVIVEELVSDDDDALLMSDGTIEFD